VRALARLAADGVAGVIIGRALYTGAVALADALGAVEGA
jgi:phosphoribosylformimino-5-aminoimidazole carboxamide ribonucleotide (ProFAR) isomerase